MKTKKWYQSTTFWVNVIAVAIGFTDVLSAQNLIPESLYVPILAGLNIILRLFKTDSATTL